MEEITEELSKRSAVICISCGRIFAGAADSGGILQPCPGCGAESNGLFWVTPYRSWIDTLWENANYGGTRCE